MKHPSNSAQTPLQSAQQVCTVCGLRPVSQTLTEQRNIQVCGECAKKYKKA